MRAIPLLLPPLVAACAPAPTAPPLALVQKVGDERGYWDAQPPNCGDPHPPPTATAERALARLDQPLADRAAWVAAYQAGWARGWQHERDLCRRIAISERSYTHTVYTGAAARRVQREYDEAARNWAAEQRENEAREAARRLEDLEEANRRTRDELAAERARTAQLEADVRAAEEARRDREWRRDMRRAREEDDRRHASASYRRDEALHAARVAAERAERARRQNP